MMKTRFRLLLFNFNFVILLIYFNVSCRDTCNKKMGDTFKDIRYNSFTFSSGTDGYIASFDISVNEALPVGYLRTASQEPTDNSAIDSIAFPDINQMNIYLKKSIIPQRNELTAFQFKMKMHDRKDFTNCTHPGPSLKYEISLSFTIHNNEEVYSVDQISWSESILKGTK